MNDKKKLSSFALISLILGILSSMFYWLFGLIPVLAIIFGIVALHRIKTHNQKGKGFAITGLILGILFIVALRNKHILNIL